MKSLLRSLIAFPIAVVLWSSAAPPAHAAKTLAHDAASVADIGRVGFLDLKTFLIGPSSQDDPALASERMRVISPETLLYGRAGGSTTDPPAGYPDLPASALSKRPRPDADSDSLTIRVNGAPLTLSLGLRDALRRDLEESIRLFGVSGLFDPIPGIASAGMLGNAAGDVLRQIDGLEAAVASGVFHHDMMRAFPEPSSLSLFAFGLLAMGWLRRSWPPVCLSPRRS